MTNIEIAHSGVKMLAYHNDEAIKEKYLSRVADHRAADELLQGYGYWKDGKGCAVGCTIHGGNHQAYETELGIPATIAHLEDGLFERLPVDLARQWPERFLNAIRPGADLSKVTARFMVWLLVDPADGVIRFVQEERFAQQRTVIEQCADLWQRVIDGGSVSDDEWSNAAAAAAWAARAAAAWAAEAASIKKQADKLIELLESAPAFRRAAEIARGQ